MKTIIPWGGDKFRKKFFNKDMFSKQCFLKSTVYKHFLYSLFQVETKKCQKQKQSFLFDLLTLFLCSICLTFDLCDLAFVWSFCSKLLDLILLGLFGFIFIRHCLLPCVRSTLLAFRFCLFDRFFLFSSFLCWLRFWAGSPYRSLLYKK